MNEHRSRQHGIGLAFLAALGAWLCMGASGATLASAGSGQEQVPVGPRPLALGGAFTAVGEGIDAVYWNPAGLGRLRVSGLRATNADLHGLGIQDNMITLVSPLGSRFGVGLEWYHSGFDDGELNDALNRMNVSLGWRVRSALSVGASVKYRIHDQGFEGTDAGRGTGFGADLGLLIQPLRNLRLGVQWQDVGGSSLDYGGGREAQPFDGVLNAGVAWWPRSGLLLSTEIGRDAHAGVEINLLDQLHLRGGWRKDLDGLDGAQLSAGFGVRYGPALLDYAYQSHAELDGTHRFGLSMDFSLTPKLVEIGDASFDPLFASLYKSYPLEAPGHVILKNTSDDLLEVSIRIHEDRYMNEAIGLRVALRPGVVQELDLPLLFSSNITSLRESVRLPLKIDVTYESAGRRRTDSIGTEATMYEMGTMTWGDGVDRAAAFVTPSHHMVDEFTQNILRVDIAGSRRMFSDAMMLAARLFNGMSACGLRYRPDPLNPYVNVQGNSTAVDDIQYPAELLLRGVGDCDDCTVLYASMLANIGIRTVFLDVPGHIFLMFDSGRSARDLPDLGVDPSMLIAHEGTIWIPVETTSLGEPFHVAWQQGAKLYRQFQLSGQLNSVDVERARAAYPAAVYVVALRSDQAPPEVVPSAIRQQTAEDLAVIAAWKDEYLREHFLGDATTQESVSEKLRIARVFYLNHDYDRAAGELLSLASTGASAAVWNDLGATQLARGDNAAALQSFSAARGENPTNAGIALNQGMALMVMGESQRARVSFGDAVRLAQGVENALDLLGMKRRRVLGQGKAGEPVAMEQLTLKLIEDLLREAMTSVPESTATPNLTLGDSLQSAQEELGSAESDSTAGDRELLPTAAGAPRGFELGRQVVQDLLYWMAETE